MVNKIFLLSIAVVVIIGGASWYIFSNNTPQPAVEEQAAESAVMPADDLVAPETVETEQTNSDLAQAEQTTAVVDEFLTLFIAAAPPAADPQAVDRAVMLLSEGAKMEMSSSPTSADLAALMGVQDVPDNGYDIGEAILLPNAATGDAAGMAEVDVTLNYSGEIMDKVFLLSKTTQGWLIDRVN